MNLWPSPNLTNDRSRTRVTDTPEWMGCQIENPAKENTLNLRGANQPSLTVQWIVLLHLASCPLKSNILDGLVPPFRLIARHGL